MSERIGGTISEALSALRASLQRIEASPALDARFEESLVSWSAQRLRARRRRRLSWALAAAAAGVLVVSTGWLVLHVETPPLSGEPHSSGPAKVAAVDPAVLRMRASLGAQLPVGNGNGNGLSPRRRHYWVDVGVEPDGTLYIERVTPIDEDPQLFVP